MSATPEPDSAPGGADIRRNPTRTSQPSTFDEGPARRRGISGTSSVGTSRASSPTYTARGPSVMPGSMPGSEDETTVIEDDSVVEPPSTLITDTSRLEPEPIVVQETPTLPTPPTLPATHSQPSNRSSVTIEDITAQEGDTTLRRHNLTGTTIRQSRIRSTSNMGYHETALQSIPASITSSSRTSPVELDQRLGKPALVHQPTALITHQPQPQIPMAGLPISRAAIADYETKSHHVMPQVRVEAAISSAISDIKDDIALKMGPIKYIHANSSESAAALRQVGRDVADLNLHTNYIRRSIGEVSEEQRASQTAHNHLVNQVEDLQDKVDALPQLIQDVESRIATMEERLLEAILEVDKKIVS
ncbi:hypothetical protein RHS04_07682 [Rhizoctonia solani]|uniref:Uncharacterized protein n=1 Tax=Rhizoctonia solani TaxID=456999 RepID=A0A8H7H3H4_9AGAM|nr:hypothetical protein RHS04_07682 [Rhizoctonia solani]